jgi:hypothetical protein
MFSILLRDIGAVLISLPDNSSTRDIVDAMWRSNAFQSLLVIVTAILTASTLLQIAERAIIRSRAKKMR